MLKFSELLHIKHAFLIVFALAKGPIEDTPVTPANAPVKTVNDQRSKIQSLFVSFKYTSIYGPKL